VYLPELIRELENLSSKPERIFAAQASPGPLVPIHPLITPLPLPDELDE
jgi:hypothetical protein